MKGILLLMLFTTTFFSCEKVNPNYQQEAANPELLHRAQQQLTDIIVHDIFSPPVASRIYAYSSIAAYEAAVNGYPGYQSLAGQLRDLTPFPKPEQGKEYCFPVAGLRAYCTVGKALIFSEEKMEAFEVELDKELKEIGIPRDVYDRSVAFGDAVARHILEWSGTDNYKQTRTFPKYSITEEPALWQPTPPDYMDGVEPHWGKIRPMFLDSAAQFVPAPPTAFDPSPNSQFMKELMEVYEAMKVEDTMELNHRVAIAQFWDCNPYVSHHTGHVMYATKKITPGGHWMGITKLACLQDKSDFIKSASTYTMTSLALFDAFISCWDEKYRSNVVRPETVINRLVDEDWLPALQTPPFPEYTSGHSVISRASAVALTSIFGDNFNFVDSVEVAYGLPPRSFKSFKEASEEAAISRLYGGIHYRPAIFNGVSQGEKVGNLLVERVSMKQEMIGEKK